MAKYETPIVMVGDRVVYMAYKEGVETYIQGVVTDARTIYHQNTDSHEWMYTVCSGEEDFEYPTVSQYNIKEKLCNINYISNA